MVCTPWPDTGAPSYVKLTTTAPVGPAAGTLCRPASRRMQSHAGEPQMDGPVQRSGPAVGPDLAQLHLERRQRVRLPLVLVPLHGRPCLEVTHDLPEVPVGDEIDGRHRILGERKRQRAIAALDISPLGRPVLTHYVRVEIVDERVDACIDPEDRIRPGCDDTAGHEHATAFAVETVEIEPVRGLGGDDERNAA